MAKSPNVLERAVFAANLAPALILDVNGATTFRALSLAVRLGLFRLHRKGAQSAQGIADALKLDAGATESWLRLLAAAGYLRRVGTSSGMGFGNSPGTARWLLPGGPVNFELFLPFWDQVVLPFWDAQMEAVLRGGAPSQSIYRWMDTQPGAWHLAQAWFRETARSAAPEIARRAQLPAGASRLLDLGGGHGWYSAAFCQAVPGLSAEVLDGPGALESLAATVQELGMERRILGRRGDYLQGPPGEGYDVVLMFNVLHAHQTAEAAKAFQTAARALRPGGKVLILDQVLGRAPGPTFNTFFHMLDLNYRIVLGGRAYTYQELVSLATEAGFHGPRRIPLRQSPGSTLMEATL